MKTDAASRTTRQPPAPSIIGQPVVGYILIVDAEAARRAPYSAKVCAASMRSSSPAMTSVGAVTAARSTVVSVGSVMINAMPFFSATAKCSGPSGDRSA